MAADFRQKKLKQAEQRKWEDLLCFHLDTHGLKGCYVRNYRKAIPGSQLEVDVALLEYKVALEIQGDVFGKVRSGHSTGAGIRRDCEKARLLQLNGWHILPFTSDEVRDLKAIDFTLLFLKIAKGIEPGAKPSRAM